jgi:acyl-CoA oxidase
MLISNFFTALSSSAAQSLSQPAPETLRSLFRLFALYTIDNASSSFITTSAIPISTLELLPDALLECMTEHVRPHAVKLVDAWAIPDYVLDSALGRKDGKAYEALFEYAHYKNPMNSIVFNPYYWDEEIVWGTGRGIETASTTGGSKL